MSYYDGDDNSSGDEPIWSTGYSLDLLAVY